MYSACTWQGLRMNEEKLGLYLFYEEDGVCMGVWQGEIDNINPAVNCRLHYTKDDVGEAENFSKINGVIMSNGSGRKYASVWNDMAVDVDHMTVWTAKPKEVLHEVEEEPAEAKEPRSEEVQVEARPVEVTPVEEVPAENAISVSREAEEPEVQAALETSEREDCREEAPGYMSKMIQRKVTKIQRKELARLPRCEWRLANNNFLLHGYYNYHYLVFIENRQMMYLGVPGIYHEKEAQAASAFGFPDFIPARELDISLTAEECNEQEEFGFWCRQVRHPFY